MSQTLVDRLLGSQIPYITYAVPFFFLLIAIELVVGWLTRRELYRLNDSINDLSCGIIDQISRVFLESILIAGYLFLYEHFRLFDVAGWPAFGKWAAAIALLFGVDLCFYWFHRIAHEYAAPWATHVVHHQSEDYNLAVALRQSALEHCFAWVFYLPLALLGFPPLWYVAMSAINLLYQFWVHTEAIGKLGPLEWIMNTPSHHRVHHARNPKYLDKNYAGMFIIWDRLFGTFQAEEEPPVYGITRPLHSWNPLWAHVHAWVDLFRMARQAPYWTDKLKIWFMPLGWTPRGVEPYPKAGDVSRDSVRKYNARAPLRLTLYAVFQFIVVLALAMAIMHAADRGTPRAWLVAPAIIVLWSLLNLGAIFERRFWLFPSEAARLTAVLIGLVTYAYERAHFAVTAGIAAAWFAVSLAWLYFAWKKLTPRPETLTTKHRSSGEPAAQSPLVVPR
jgi:sterol desaturase/sphingolipid hydroxylase (fatty acid hydroxylase superfamily)